jgi:hypothetical protein
VVHRASRAGPGPLNAGICGAHNSDQQDGMGPSWSL